MALCKHGEENCTRCALEAQSAPPLHIHFILDNSASMASAWPETLSGLNEYFASLRADKEQRYRVSLVIFGSEINTLLDDVVLDAVPEYGEQDIAPTGSSTRLYDAVGETVQQINTTEPVTVVVLTDGANNASRIWDSARVDQLSAERIAQGNYNFVYLGVDKAAWNKGAAFHAAAQSQANFTGGKQGRAAAFASLNANVRGYSRAVRGATSGGMGGQSLGSISYFVEPDVSADTTNTGNVTYTVTPTTTNDPEPAPPAPPPTQAPGVTIKK